VVMITSMRLALLAVLAAVSFTALSLSPSARPVAVA